MLNPTVISTNREFKLKPIFVVQFLLPTSTEGEDCFDSRRRGRHYEGFHNNYILYPISRDEFLSRRRAFRRRTASIAIEITSSRQDNLGFKLMIGKPRDVLNTQKVAPCGIQFVSACDGCSELVRDEAFVTVLSGCSRFDDVTRMMVPSIRRKIMHISGFMAMKRVHFFQRDRITPKQASKQNTLLLTCLLAKRV
jgi:hypothetical protein